MTTTENIKLHESWKRLLMPEFQSGYMQDLKAFLQAEARAKKVVYPKGEEIFSALNLTPLENVKVVIIGQDPYHGPGQAHGLCFSVKKGVRIPPSLQNIYKELKNDLGIQPPSHGFLEAWAKQGVLMLNNVLTVQDGLAGSHQGKGWEQFTDRIIQRLNEEKENLVFILWGTPAQKKAAAVNPKKHLILKSVHPSPLSAHRGFFGTRPFSQTNEYLRSKGLPEIDWSISE